MKDHGKTADPAPGRVRLDRLEVTYTSTKSRRRTRALAETSVELGAGSFTALLGPSGCGKSTLLNVIAGFVPPSAGSAELDGNPITGPGPDRTVVFQQYALLPWMTATANVEFALERWQLPRAERRDRARQALAAVHLSDAADKMPGEMSGGMQQRVAIARAMAAEPDVLLMDEPFGALDAITRARMQELALTLWSETGRTVVFVTHDVDEALFLSQRILLMDSAPGRIVADIDLLGADDARRADVRSRIVARLGGH
ncbi:ABC transporter ATP-binding protein [Rhodococcus triatomae]|uniref:NitT/TauT family transport system ATP-binding protein/taurine transport system ATP-binding protein n=1 Tax=Rhodococcus triatomae TaxID=300028 RepID=A0A1G8GJC0_9NOCA|nr:ABC transporter ATP-binding protein [Rhodococcus triatomae]QNG20361.1 ABC transporter ATP-binding protein [Rhodococcus triatomae]QNG23723.1 ABC transporter ATP-binding protein [Rhodococcus triatomae]SDH94494.1 NitT/TauT family transport system ATP-binding protein/taurine transport system ATP-binding protein [Rhodococcus triatomae]